MPILTLHLGRAILYHTALALSVLLALFLFVGFLEEVGDIGRGDYHLPAALAYIALNIPRIVYELLPMAALLGGIVGLSLLANDSELIAMRAGGVSLLRLTAAALQTGAAVAVAAVLIGELLAPPADLRAARLRGDALQDDARGLWLRDAESYIHIGEVLPDGSLLRVRIFAFDDARELQRLTVAGEAHYENDEWQLRQVQQTVFADGVATAAHLANSTWQTDITPQLVAAHRLQPEHLSLMQLHRYIAHLHNNRQDAAPFQLAFWGKLALPLSAALMLALAVPFVFVNPRSGALGRNVFVGILIGLGFYAAHKGFGYAALAYGMPPLLGAGLPLLLFAGVAAALLRKAG